MGSVSYMWGHAIPMIKDKFPDASVVALWRDEEPWLESVMENMNGDVLHDETTRAQLFPTYDLPEEQAWLRYHAEYYDRIDEEVIFHIDDLNTDDGRTRLLTAAGLTPTDED